MLTAFRGTCCQHGTPASTLTDNGMVFTTRLAGGRGGLNALEKELQARHIRQKNSTPNQPEGHPRPRDHPLPRARPPRARPPRPRRRQRRRDPATRGPAAPHRHRPNPRPNHVILLVQNLEIRIVHAATGELLRELTLDPTKDYQPQTKNKA